MRGTGALIHPRFRQSLERYFPDRCTIQGLAESRTGSGEVTTSPVDLAGHVDLPARLAPMAGTQERRRRWGTYREATHLIALLGHYPAISTDHQAVIAGVAYGIEGVYADSAEQITYLPARKVTP